MRTAAPPRIRMVLSLTERLVLLRSLYQQILGGDVAGVVLEADEGSKVRGWVGGRVRHLAPAALSSPQKAWAGVGPKASQDPGNTLWQSAPVFKLLV